MHTLNPAHRHRPCTPRTMNPGGLARDGELPGRTKAERAGDCVVRPFQLFAQPRTRACAKEALMQSFGCGKSCGKSCGDQLQSDGMSIPHHGRGLALLRCRSPTAPRIPGSSKLCCRCSGSLHTRRPSPRTPAASCWRNAVDWTARPKLPVQPSPARQRCFRRPAATGSLGLPPGRQHRCLPCRDVESSSGSPYLGCGRGPQRPDPAASRAEAPR